MLHGERFSAEQILANSSNSLSELNAKPFRNLCLRNQNEMVKIKIQQNLRITSAKVGSTVTCSVVIESKTRTAAAALASFFVVPA